jgi:hypothetical protein
MLKLEIDSKKKINEKELHNNKSCQMATYDNCSEFLVICNSTFKIESGVEELINDSKQNCLTFHRYVEQLECPIRGPCPS